MKSDHQNRQSHTSRASAQSVAQSKSASSTFEDKRPEALQAQQLSTDIAQAQKKANNTGLPDQLKSGIENLSGYSMDDVKVHYNSGKPSQLNAHAYAQGTDIHLASGQEKHLPHEAWHVVQQKQGRVKPTVSVNGAAVNDDVSLESEADVMGSKAMVQLFAKDHDQQVAKPSLEIAQLEKKAGDHYFNDIPKTLKYFFTQNKTAIPDDLSECITILEGIRDQYKGLEKEEDNSDKGDKNAAAYGKANLKTKGLVDKIVAEIDKLKVESHRGTRIAIFGRISALTDDLDMSYQTLLGTCRDIEVQDLYKVSDADEKTWNQQVSSASWKLKTHIREIAYAM